MHSFYLSRYLPGDLYDNLVEELKQWAITLIAIRQIGVDSLTEDEIAVIQLNEENRYLFRLEQVDLETAGNVLNEMINAVKERNEQPSQP